jgi:outer membrane lipoprotein SlyB
MQSEKTRVAAAEPAKPMPGICADCGKVTTIHVVEQEGEGTGLGAVAGGVIGGVLGNQIGRGSGRKIATVAGAAGGAYAGHQAEKHVKSTRRWSVAVRMENGSTRMFSYDDEPSVRVGDFVKIRDGRLMLN